MAVSLGVDMGEARLVRLSVMGMFEEGFSKDASAGLKELPVKEAPKAEAKK